MLSEGRVLVAALGIRSVVRMIRRRREAAAGGPPLTRGERLEQRGAVIIALAPVLVVMSLFPSEPLSSFLLYGAALAVVVGLGLFVASGVVEGLGDPHGITPKPAIGRNDPCPCGSGEKYKRCHGAA
jgi:hypothetical protein